MDEVHRERWTTILGYNLIRTTAAAAALLHQKQPRQIRFTSTCQYVLASWMQLSNRLVDQKDLEAYLLLMLEQIAGCEVANRPGRLEPRVLKRRGHRYRLLQIPGPRLRREMRMDGTISSRTAAPGNCSGRLKTGPRVSVGAVEIGGAPPAWPGMIVERQA